MKFICWAIATPLLLACNTDDQPALLRGQVEGVAWFLGPVADAPVTLHLSDSAGSDRGVVAEGTTEADGSFFFRGIAEEGHYLVRIELAGLPWRTELTEGAFAPGDRLETATGLIEPFAREAAQRERAVYATPLSTLILAAAESRRSVNREGPLPEALLGARLWLGFDPTTTGIGPRTGAVDDAVRHTLVLDAFNWLADDISAAVGIQPGTTFNPPDLLRFLLLDARAPVPAGMFDGVGPDGALVVDAARNYPLSDQTLQSELRDALDTLVAQPEGPWARLEPRDISDLRSRLTCSDSPLFPDCKDERTDETPPQLIRVTPEPGEELSGERSLTAVFFDNEGVVTQATLERLDRAGGAVVETYEPTADNRDTFTFRVDTRAVLGQSTLHMQVRATNNSGLTSPNYPLEYPVRNVGEGILEGVVFKGPAANVEVEVEGTVDGRWVVLGQARTNELGRFNLPLTEYQGALRLTARGLEDETGSFFEDEARGEWVRWDADQRLVTVVPFYTPAQPEPVTVSPLGDLAVALAQAKVNTTGIDFLAAYDRSVESLAVHFGFADPQSLLHAQPVDPRIDSRGLSDSVDFTIALACLSEQARGLGCTTFDCTVEDVGDRFTALHLIEMYRQDALDGFFDGVNANGVVQRSFPGNPVPAVLPPDPLRHPLATACARWIDAPLNGTGVSLAAYINELQARSLNVDPWLFHPDRMPEPFDRAGPEVSVELAAIEGEPESLVSGPTLALEAPDAPPAPAASGRVRLRFVAQDDAGIATRLDDGEPALEAKLLGDFPVNPLEILPQDTPQGVQTTRFIEATLDLTLIPEALEGVDLRFEVTADDLLQQRTTRVFRLAVDRRPPEISLHMPGGFREHEDTWHTRLRDNDRSVGVRIEAAGPITYRLIFGEEVLANDQGIHIGFDQPLALAARQEGALPLRLEATDRLNRRAVADRTVIIDRTPPRATLRPAHYLDESRASTQRHDLGNYLISLPPDAERIEVDAAGATPYRKVTTRLDALGENLLYLSFDVADQPGQDCRDPENCPNTRPSELFARRPGDPALALDRLGFNHGIRGIHLTADVLGVDPQNPPDAGTPWRLRFEVEDLAGNVAEVEGPLLHLELLPPPPHIEVLPIEDGLALDAMTFEDLGPALVAGTPIVLGRYRITNPWPVPVSYFIAQPEPLHFEGTTRILPLEADHLIGEGNEPPSDQPFALPPWRVEPGCLATPEGGFDLNRLALAWEREEVRDGVRVRVVTGQACGPKVEHEATVPTGAARVDVGRVSGQFSSRLAQWRGILTAAEPGRNDVEVWALTDAWDSGSPDLQALLQSDGDHLYAERLDVLRILFWNGPIGAERGWWYTWRVRALTAVRMQAPSIPIQFAVCAADQAGARCDPKARITQELQAPINTLRRD